MSSLRSAIKARMGAGEMTALVGSRVRFNKYPQKPTPTLPYVVYNIASDEYTPCAAGIQPNARTADVSFTVVARDAEQGEPVVELIKQLWLPFYGGIAYPNGYLYVAGVSSSPDNEQYDPFDDGENGLYEFTVNMTVEYDTGMVLGPVGPTGIGPLPGWTGGGGVGATGPQGPPGATGPQGAPGVDGATGPQGVPGVQGNTGPQGVPGIDGLTGPQGAPGIQGSTGLQGVPGIQGQTGVQGVPGFNGSTGPQGAAGIQGSTGLQGVPGIQGSTGLQGVPGIQGSTGLQGVPGLNGSTGPQGAPGIQGQTGVQGAPGIQGQTGVQGAPGIQGQTGLQGITGLRGITGVGVQGATGLAGPAGPQGMTGVQGATGLAGPAGSQGMTGVQGATGVQADSSDLVSKSPDTITRNRITIPSAANPGLEVVLASGQSANAWSVLAPGATLPLAVVDYQGKLVLTRNNFNTPIQVFNNGYTANALEVRTGTPSTSNALIASLSFDGRYQAAGGSALAPGYSFAGDTDSGMFGGTNTLGLVVGGRQILGIGSNYRIALGSNAATPTVGLHQFGGGYRLQSLVAPQPTVSVNTTGSTTYYYALVAEDVAGNRSLPSAVRLVSNSAATPNNSITLPFTSGVATWYVLRNATGTFSGTSNCLAGIGAPGATFTDTVVSPISFTVVARNGTADAVVDGSMTAGGSLSVGGGTFTASEAGALVASSAVMESMDLTGSNPSLQVLLTTPATRFRAVEFRRSNSGVSGGGFMSDAAPYGSLARTHAGGRLSLGSFIDPTYEDPENTPATSFTLRYVPYVDRYISLWNADENQFELVIISALATIASSSLTNDTNYDIFAYISSYGSTGPVMSLTYTAWASDTARQSGLNVINTLTPGAWYRQDSVAYRYLGTVRKAATGADHPGYRFVWNVHNQMPKGVEFNLGGSGTTSWSIAATNTQQTRVWGGSTQKHVQFVVGLDNTPCHFEVKGSARPPAGGYCYLGLGLDQPSSNPAAWQGFFPQGGAASNENFFQLSASGKNRLGKGYHWVSALEAAFGTAGGTQTSFLTPVSISGWVWG